MLPSKYAPQGLSRHEQKKSITTGNRIRRPVNYTVRTIREKVDDAVNREHNDTDIEMIPMDNYNEVDLISEFVNQSRSQWDNNDFMEIDIGGNDSVNSDILSYLVVDTNFMLSHLNIIDDIEKLAAKYSLTIIIPIVVMKELDGLKKSDRLIQEDEERLSGRTVGHLARWANDWIYNCLANSSSAVMGQKIRQKIDKLAVKDEAILDCCVYFKENYGNLVVLLSNDKNLCLKALSNDILTVSFRKEMNADVICSAISEECVSRGISGSSNNYSNNDNNTNGNNLQPITPSNSNHPHTFKEARDIIHDEILQLLKSAIDAVMKSNFGDELDLIDYDYHKISSIQDCCRVINRFWISVFSEYLRITDYARDSVLGIPSTLDELEYFLPFWYSVLLAIYNAEFNDHQQKALHILENRWQTICASVE